MRIKDIKLSEVAAGKNWRVASGRDDGWAGLPIVDWPVEPAPALADDDIAVYSALTVFRDGTVRGLLQIKEVSTPDYGGDYCEYVEGSWRQVGLVSDPDALDWTEPCVANPAPGDPSFTGHYSPEAQRARFSERVLQMRLD